MKIISSYKVVNPVALLSLRSYLAFELIYIFTSFIYKIHKPEISWWKIVEYKVMNDDVLGLKQFDHSA